MASNLSELVERGIRYWFFGGKGGVGKTSCAAACALRLAEEGKKTLIISTDPAHSLSDSFRQPIGGEIKPIEGVSNLFALEIDPKRYVSETAKVLGESGFAFAWLFMGAESFPGIDEAVAFTKVLEYVGKPEYDAVVFDTAPTGHTLRLLELPDFLDSWVGKLVEFKLRMDRLFSAFKKLLGKESEKDETLEALQLMKETIRKAKQVLTDPSTSTFVIVLLPEAMAIWETERLLTHLESLRIPVEFLVVNMVVPENPCNFCRTRRSMQLKHLEEIREMYRDEFKIVEVPLFPREITGIERLRELSEYLMGPRGG